MKPGEPIKPSEIAERKVLIIPAPVIEAFNDLIAKNYNSVSGEAIVHQKYVIVAIREKFREMGVDVPKDDDIFKNQWLDVESIFESAGWSVYYDKPAYCESYEAFFRFKNGIERRR